MLLGSVESWEHNWQNNGDIITEETEDVLIVPVVKRSLCHLEVRTGNTLGQLPKQGNHDFGEFSWLYHVQDFFKFIEEHYLQNASRTN